MFKTRPAFRYIFPIFSIGGGGEAAADRKNIKGCRYNPGYKGNPFYQSKLIELKINLAALAFMNKTFPVNNPKNKVSNPNYNVPK